MFSQAFVILSFFAGMLLNYYALLPSLDMSEAARIEEDLDSYFDCFTPSHKCNAHNQEELDSALALINNPFGGDYFIADGNFQILSSRDGEKGYLNDVLDEKYGGMATNLLENEFNSNDSKSSMDYDQSEKTSYYARYESWNDLMFFYVANYLIAGKELIHTLRMLLLFMIVGGLLILTTSILIVRRIEIQLKDESLIQQELDTAAVIQKSMLPQGEKHLIQLDVDARLIPARKVGGDFYCYYLNNGLLYFCIGDVSGKGIPAALFMSKGVTLFRSFAKAGKSPRELAENMNEELCIHNESNMFITGILGTLRIYDGYMT